MHQCMWCKQPPHQCRQSTRSQVQLAWKCRVRFFMRMRQVIKKVIVLYLRNRKWLSVLTRLYILKESLEEFESFMWNRAVGQGLHKYSPLMHWCYSLVHHRASIFYFFYKMRLRNMLWRHNRVCIDWCNIYNTCPITACVRHNLFYNLSYHCSKCSKQKMAWTVPVVGSFSLRKMAVIGWNAVCVKLKYAGPSVDQDGDLG